MRYLSALLLLFFWSGQLMAEDISSSDFAAGYYLEVDQTGAFYSLELPEDVYRTVQSSALGDIRIFNAAGEVVPHEFRPVKTDPTALREKENLPFFPLFQTNTPGDSAELSLQISRDKAGAVVNIKPAPAEAADEQKISGYLLDLSGLKQTASELEFSWQKETDSSLFSVHIEQSDDLQRWSPLVHRATLADLQFAGEQVTRRTVSLPRPPLKYLKLTWQESGPLLNLSGVTSYSQMLQARRRHHWVSLGNGVAQEKDDRLLIDFATTYKLPTGSVQIRFPEINSLARLAIQSRPASGNEWRTRCEQVFYNLSFAGTSIENEPCRFPATADPLWRVVVQQDGAGLRTGHGALTLQLGWPSRELLFVGRGEPPYLLAFGSGRLAQQGAQPSQSQGMLLQTITTQSPSPVIGYATIGKRILLGGDAALQSPVKPPPWKKWLLWAVLLLGVGLLAYMVRVLTKEMNKAEEKRVAGER